MDLINQVRHLNPSSKSIISNQIGSVIPLNSKEKFPYEKQLQFTNVYVILCTIREEKITNRKEDTLSCSQLNVVVVCVYLLPVFCHTFITHSPASKRTPDDSNFTVGF